MGLIEYIYVYLLGGITFLPIVVISFIYFHPIVSRSKETETSLQAGEIEENNQSGLETYKAGWITVTQEYLESTDEINSSTQSISESSENKSAYSSLYKLVQKDNSGTEIIDTSSSQTTEKVRSSQKKHRFYAILKHGNLFLYKDEKLRDVKHVIVLSNQIITIWPRNLPDGQLFTKRTSICIIRKDWSRLRRLSDNFSQEKITTFDVLNHENKLKPPKGSFFIYCDLNIDKEDWYFALIRSTKIDDQLNNLNPKFYAKTLHFETENMINLIQTLYSSEGQLQTKWLNALIGRLFLSLQKTELLQNFLKNRIAKKLNKIKKPGFLEKFQIENIFPGNSAPFFTYPNLKEISPDGTIIVSAYVHYHGNLSLQISTKVNINLGSRFKPREVDLLLSITLEKLEGPLLIKIKPPPSERLWYSFEIEPIINLKIEPIISSRQLTYNIITNQIEKKFKEAIKDSLVLPHWDDFIFYDTTDEIYRGGIWDKSERPENNSFSQSNEVAVEENDSESSNNVTDSKSDLTNRKPNASSKTKISNTLNDLSKKIRKTKSSHTLGINEEHCLSDGSLVDNNTKGDQESISSDSSLSKKSTINTLKKIGKWYFKDEKTVSEHNENYTRPEMISNRRNPRKSNADQTKSIKSQSTIVSQPSYDFAKYNDNSSIYNNFENNQQLTATIGLSNSEKPPLPPRDEISITSHSIEQLKDPIKPTALNSNESNEVSDSIHSENSLDITKNIKSAPTSVTSNTFVEDNHLHRKPPPMHFSPELPPRELNISEEVNEPVNDTTIEINDSENKSNL